ncbi:MAG: hypothetical protein FJ293_01875 [Planctomycetes bacterium]|nr:hypothetical protein [Planctomycetota bacterium]
MALPAVGATMVALAGAIPPAAGQAPPAADDAAILRRLDALERQNAELRARLDAANVGGAADELDADLAALGAPGGAAAGQAGDGAAKLMAGSERLADSGLSQAFGGLYTKPFLAGFGNVALGGYVDFEYFDVDGVDRDFRFHRLIPFIYAQPSEHVRFATEIEIEDGHEVDVEFAVVDLLIRDAFNFRAGVILSPLGKFNLVHDSPVNELTDRPLVDQFVIPTTLHEAGFGGFGTLATADSPVGQVTYEAYLTGGFKGLLDDGTAGFDDSSGLRGGRPHDSLGAEKPYNDINNAFAGVGRVEWSPQLGGVLGVSAHHGTYDEGSENHLTIVALDGALDGRLLSRLLGLDGSAGSFVDGFEFLAEAAHARLETDALAEASGIPDRLAGWYGQLNYRLYPDFLAGAGRLSWIDAGAHITLVVRRDEVDLDGSERERWTFGVNFRPNQSQTVLKFDYQLNSESGTRAPVDNDAFVASIATYF